MRIDNDLDRGAGAVVEAARRIVDEAIGIDDPVRMYLREIGKVPLLTAEDEKRLARAMEEWIHVDAIREEFRNAEGGATRRHVEVLIELFKQFHQERADLPGGQPPPRAAAAVGVRAHRRPEVPLDHRPRARRARA